MCEMSRFECKERIGRFGSWERCSYVVTTAYNTAAYAAGSAASNIIRSVVGEA